MWEKLFSRPKCIFNRSPQISLVDSAMEGGRTRALVRQNKSLYFLFCFSVVLVLHPQSVRVASSQRKCDGEGISNLADVVGRILVSRKP